MTKQTRIIIGFSAAIVLLCGVLVYGLYRRAATANLRAAKAKRARMMATMSLQEFAWEPVARQDELLAEAGGAAAHAQTPDALGQWVRTRTRLRTRIAELRAALAAIAMSMAYRFPQDPDEQLAPEVAGRLTAAVRKARTVGGGTTTVEVDGHRVDVTAVVAGDLHKLALRAAEVEAELARREDTYTAFVEGARWAVRGANAPAAAAAAQQLSGKWLARVKSDPVKKKTLTKLEQDLADFPARHKARNKAACDLDAVVKELGVVASGVALAPLAGRCGAAITAAQAHPSLKPRIEKARRVLAAARERTGPKPLLTPAEREKERKWQLTLQIGRTVIEISKIIGRGPAEQLARKTKLGEIQTPLSELQRVDSSCADALGMLVVVWYSQAGHSSAPPAAPAVQRSFKPDWRQLKALSAMLAEADDALAKIRRVAKAAPVAMVSTATGSHPDPRDVARKKAALSQLDSWIALLKKQKDDVRVLSTMNKK